MLVLASLCGSLTQIHCANRVDLVISGHLCDCSRRSSGGLCRLHSSTVEGSGRISMGLGQVSAQCPPGRVGLSSVPVELLRPGHTHCIGKGPNSTTAEGFQQDGPLSPHICLTWPRHPLKALGVETTTKRVPSES